MTVEAKFTTAGMTKGKQYDVIEEKKCVNATKSFLMMELWHLDINVDLRL